MKKQLLFTTLLFSINLFSQFGFQMHTILDDPNPTDDPYNLSSM